MRDSQDDRKLRQLTAEFIDGRLDEASREELNFLLRDDSANRLTFLSMLDLQCEMLRLMSADELPEDVKLPDDVGLPDDVKSTDASARPSVAKRSRPSGLLRRDSLPVVWAIASTAACILMAVTYWLFRVDVPSVSTGRADDSIPSAVRIGQATATEFFDETPKAAGESLKRDHEYVMTSGVVSLDFPCGAEAILESPCVFRLLADDHLLVSLGRCSLYAPEGAQGFRIDTPQAQLVDLGTRFCVDVNESGQTDVHVVEGAASVTPKLVSRDSASRHFASGDAATDETRQPLAASRSNILTVGRAQRIGFDLPEAVRPIRYRPSSYRSVLPDRVLDYDCEMTDGRGGQLRSLRIQRGGKTFVYRVADLIGIRLVHFIPHRPSHNVAAMPGQVVPLRDLLESDNHLSTGMINPGGSRVALQQSPVLQNGSVQSVDPNGIGEQAEIATGESEVSAGTPGLGFRFDTPVVNDRGPDLVLFELQSKVDPPTGDSFHVSPLRLSGSRRSHSVDRYDITMRSPLAKKSHVFTMPQFEPTTDLLKASTADATYEHLPALDFYILAVGIDLSDLGYAAGETADGLFLQDDLLDRNLIDPVWIGGLPPLPETTR